MELDSGQRNLPEHEAADTWSPRTRATRTPADTAFGSWLVQFAEKKCQGLGFTFPFLLPLPKGLFNNLFTHLTFACSNNSPWAWIILRHCVSHRVLSCFHDLCGWLSALTIWNTLGMCRVIRGFNFNHVWRDRSSVYLYWPVFKVPCVTMKDIWEKTSVWTSI